MKILHVLETLSPHYGGPVRVLTDLVSAQHRAGHQVEVFTTQADHPRGVFHERGWGHLDGCVRVYFGGLLFEPLRVSLDLAKLLRRELRRFDVVHVHGLYRFPPTYAAYEARRQGVPYIICAHGALDPYLYEKSSRSVLLKRTYERWFDMPNLGGAGAIHYTSEEERNRADMLAINSPSFVIPNGLDWQSYETLPSRGALRKRWGLSESPLVLFLGRLHTVKGLDLLIPAFEVVRRNLPDARLVIAGPENDGHGLEVRTWVHKKGLGGAVHFVGPLHGSDVIQAYVDADIFVLPSYAESFGLTVVEAMACGLPVVISNQVNVHAEVAQAKAGVVTRCDVHEVADAISMLLGCPEMRENMGEGGRRLVRERFTWPTIVQDLTARYQEVIERHHRNRNRDC